MPRPRLHDIDELLDVAERLMADSGPASLTSRALATAAGVPNGTIYHAFGSRAELLARVWLRAAQRFLCLQDERVDAALAGQDEPDLSAAVAAVVAAATTPLAFAERHPHAARLLFAQRRDHLLTPELPAALADELAGTDKHLVSLLIRLAYAVWRRRDAVAVEAVTACVVDLPTGLLRRQVAGPGPLDPQTHERLQAAVQAVLTLPLPPAPPQRGFRATVRKDDDA